jgi:integrase/recombinase XerD
VPQAAAGAKNSTSRSPAVDTWVRVAELVRIRLADVDLDVCQIRITQRKGSKDRIVPFPAAFKETLALHIDAQR